MKELGLRFSDLATKHPLATMVLTLVPTVVLIALATLPSVWPESFPFLHAVAVDTDPENMLSQKEAVRVFHDHTKKQFQLHDMVVVGIVNEVHPAGVFNVESLRRIHGLTAFAKTLQWPDPENPGRQRGVVVPDLLAPSVVDSIEPGGPGTVRFEWLMPAPPDTEEQALAIRDKAQRLPFLNGTLVSEDGKAICIYLPLTAKDLSYDVYQRLRQKIATYTGNDRFFITGLPVAEDTFGVEMFIQMAISAPLAMLAIFLLMLLFFRKLLLIIAPLILAFIAVVWTMALLIATGNTIHIMSSMIPIFIMPIAVLDSVHILSLFFDRYQQQKDRVKTLDSVMESLFMPMLYTSLTSAAGFASLALTPIPPVQVFGLFCAFGIMAAWALTITFIPAYIALIPETRLQSFGALNHEESGPTALSRGLHSIGRLTHFAAVPILFLGATVALIAVYGIFQIRINDNPIKWFKKSHPIRVADRVLNDHFGGTYMAYLALSGKEDNGDVATAAADIAAELKTAAEELTPDVPAAPAVFTLLQEHLTTLKGAATSRSALLENLMRWAEEQSAAADDDSYEAWDEAVLAVERQQQAAELFKQPDVLNYIIQLQTYLEQIRSPDGYQIVGKTNSLAGIVTTVHRELFEGDPAYLTVPKTAAGVAQCLITYQSSHRPHDLWHFVTSNHRQAVVWLQLHSGDNVDMLAVTKALDTFVQDHPPPRPIDLNWFGLTYINVVWQEKMVKGMMYAFLGSFLVVFLMMTVMFRSALWGLLCMIPLTLTIAVIYGAIGFLGKDYDMPVAVLSALALGLAVDFAIHFLEHARVVRVAKGNWHDAAPIIFGDPARAITRNVIVIAVGFLPLLAAPLVPYVTVGVFLAAILGISGLATLFILPALLRVLEPFLFPESKACCFACNCGTCLATAIAAAALVAINVKQFFDASWTSLTVGSLIAVALMALLCRILGHREQCRLQEKTNTTD